MSFPLATKYKIYIFAVILSFGMNCDLKFDAHFTNFSSKIHFLSIYSVTLESDTESYEFLFSWWLRAQCL